MEDLVVVAVVQQSVLLDFQAEVGNSNQTSSGKMIMTTGSGTQDEISTHSQFPTPLIMDE